MNLGLRYEYYSPLTEKYGHIANLDIAQNFTGVAVVTPGQPDPYSGSLPASLLRPDKHDFAPRVGIAWKPVPAKSTQIRASYGVYYNGGIYNQIASRLASQPPFANTTTLTTSLDAPLTLQNGFATAPSGKLITNTFAVDPNYLIGYAQTWTASIQHQLPHAVIVEIGLPGHEGDAAGYSTLTQPRHPWLAFNGGAKAHARQRCRVYLGKLRREFHLSCNAAASDPALPAGRVAQRFLYIC